MTARGVPEPQPADEPAGDPRRRHAADPAALRQRQPLRARAAAAPRAADDLDRLDRAEDDEVGRSGARRRHERGGAARGQPHPGAHADQVGLDAARAAPQFDASPTSRAASPTTRRSCSPPTRRRCARCRCAPASATASTRSPSAIASARRRSRSGTTSAPARSSRPGRRSSSMCRTRRARRRRTRRRAAAARAALSRRASRRARRPRRSKPTKTTATHKHVVAKN